MEDAGQDLVVRVAERRNDSAASPAHAPRASSSSRQDCFEDEEVGWSQSAVCFSVLFFKSALLMGLKGQGYENLLSTARMGHSSSSLTDLEVTVLESNEIWHTCCCI